MSRDTFTLAVLGLMALMLACAIVGTANATERDWDRGGRGAEVTASPSNENNVKVRGDDVDYSDFPVAGAYATACGIGGQTRDFGLSVAPTKAQCSLILDIDTEAKACYARGYKFLNKKQCPRWSHAMDDLYEAHKAEHDGLAGKVKRECVRWVAVPGLRLLCRLM
jgi:hypothetical protein